MQSFRLVMVGHPYSREELNRTAKPAGSASAFIRAPGKCRGPKRRRGYWSRGRTCRPFYQNV